MSRPAETPRRVLIGLVAVVLLGSMLPERWPSRVAAVPSAIVTPLILLPSKIVSRIRARVDRPPVFSPTDPDAVNTVASDPWAQHEREIALAQIARLRDEVQELTRQVQDLSRIRDLVGEEQFKIVKARVLDAEMTGVRPSLQLNRGSNLGVREGDLVVGYDLQLIGRIQPGSVRAGSSRVDLIFGPSSSAANVSLEVELRPADLDDSGFSLGVWIEWDDQEAAYVCRDLKPQDGVAAGWRVYLRDANWPRSARGFVLGTIAQVTPDPEDPDLRDRAVILPVLDLNQTRDVQVLVLDDGPGPPPGDVESAGGGAGG